MRLSKGEFPLIWRDSANLGRAEVMLVAMREEWLGSGREPAGVGELLLGEEVSENHKLCPSPAIS